MSNDKPVTAASVICSYSGEECAGHEFCCGSPKVPDAWQYRVILLNSLSEDIQWELNEQGDKGWELVAVDSSRAYLKRKTENV